MVEPDDRALVARLVGHAEPPRNGA
jgi:hypothetical protein